MSAFAQPEGVLDRPRPDYDAKGLPLGSFRLFPEVEINGGYDDNVLRQPVARGSAITQQIGSFNLGSEWSRHYLALFGNVAAQQFHDLPAENTVDWTIGGRGRLDVVRGTDLSVMGSHAELHEPRSSPDLPGFAAEPTPYQLTHGEFTFNYSPRSFGIRAGGRLDRFTYDPTIVNAPGAPINNADRNRNEYDLFVRTTYEFSPGYSIFAHGAYNAHDFDQTLDRNGLNRTTHGYRGNVGIALQLSHLLSGEAFVGYLEQKYKGTLKDVSGLNFGAQLDWYAAETLTVHLRAARILSATTLGGASTNDNKTFGISADYELLRNVIIIPGFTYTESTFKGLPRKDTLNSADLGVRYLINSNMSADIKYSYESRDSTSPNFNYKDNLIRLGLSLHL